MGSAESISTGEGAQGDSSGWPSIGISTSEAWPPEVDAMD